jgi:hypothetical protein
MLMKYSQPQKRKTSWDKDGDLANLHEMNAGTMRRDCFMPLGARQVSGLGMHVESHDQARFLVRCKKENAGRVKY